MILETEGIVLRQVKTLNGKRMLVIFTKKKGKISVGSTLTEGGRNKSALASRPFTYANYNIFCSRELYNLNSAQSIQSYYGIGDDVDRYMAASYVLELTDKLLVEEQPQPRMFKILEEFLKAIEKREKSHSTLVLCYMVKALDIQGMFPELSRCTACGKEYKKAANTFFSVKEGGYICSDCAKEIADVDEEPLIYNVNFDIINILNYFKDKPFSAFENLALEQKVENKLSEIIKNCLYYYFEIGGLKSERIGGI